MDAFATKDDLRSTEERLEHKIDARKQELRTEIRRTGRQLTFSLATILGAMNAITFTALELC
ncbi:MAG: hypothetical protein ACRDKA_10065 [Actinomycetota bacterium]